MVLMDPTTANLFSNFILRLVRASIEGDNQDMDTDTIEWAGRMINLGANAHRIHVTRQYKAPKLERALREEFWSTMAGFVVDEQADVAGTVDLNRDMEDAEIRIVEDLCKRSEVARKVFLQYTLERALIPDIPSLTRCLPRILNTLPPAVNPDENVDGDQVLHSFTYHSFLHSFLAVLARSHLPRLINTPRFQKVVLHDFLFPLLERWDESAHEIVARFWSEFFDVRVIGGQVGGIQHAGIGEGVRIVAEWADKAFELGKKDDDRVRVRHLLKNPCYARFSVCELASDLKPVSIPTQRNTKIYTLYHLYETLIKRSCNSYLPKKGPEKPEDEDLERNRQPYAISPPAIMEFLAQGIPGQYGIVLGSGLQNPPLGDDAMEEEMGEQEDVVMTS
ncbi:hypothetical protein BC936DRAFT_146308 [Jimgerdemannia flammicorona]|uniref:Uncharacterized protein n=1 Tax=Jimgerdemannia flammicorona TaxID=994334 RepID=A0A433DLL9_9FUNG|nr:hypothetical protein BC936DRAFT_146308 [Jimgerdemannia flammicorona]